jgi:hypothetical protein
MSGGTTTALDNEEGGGVATAAHKADSGADRAWMDEVSQDELVGYEHEIRWWGCLVVWQSCPAWVLGGRKTLTSGPSMAVEGMSMTCRPHGK